MSDTIREEEESTAAYHHSRKSKSVENSDNYDNSVDNILNGTNESIPGDQYTRFYEKYLYSLLPAIYQEHDAKENNVLEEFLKIIASQAVTIRRDIDGLLNNLFINSCEEWVIPYIADLIAARVAPNSSLNSSTRLDVQNTIRWRKLKGTPIGLEEVVRNTINSEVKIKEAFRYCSTSVHLGFLRDTTNPRRSNINNNTNFVDLHDQNTLNNIDTENDITPHLIDLREPTHANGWYNIKNLLLFLPQLNVYHIEGVETEKIRDGDGSNYNFSSLSAPESSSSKPSSYSFTSSPTSPSSSSTSVTSNSRNNDYPLYDLETGLSIRSSSFGQDPFLYFGHKKGMTIRINNILAARPDTPDFTPIEPQETSEVTIAYSASTSKSKSKPKSSTRKSDDDDMYADFTGLHKEAGIRLLEPRKFRGSDKHFIIRLYSYPKNQRDPIEIANYDTSNLFSKPYHHHLLSQRSESKKIIPFGKILLSIEPTYQSSVATTFPETVIAIRDSQPFPYVRENNTDANSVISKYQNALYVYLPDIVLNRGERKYLFVDRDGSTYYEHKVDNEEYGNIMLKGKLARRACGQIFPPGQLTYSSEPLKNFAELNRFEGIKLADANKYKSASFSFQIEGIAVDKLRNQSWKIGHLEIPSGGSPQYINEKEVWIRWTIQTSSNSKPDKDKKDSFIEESLVCNFKPTRLVLKNNNINDVTGLEELNYQEIIREMMPSEILSERALGNGIATYSIGEANRPTYNNNNTVEIDVTIKVDSRYQIQEISQKIRKAIEEKPELNNSGELVLRISMSSNNKPERTKNVSSVFPLSEIIVTNSFGKSMLVYLPQLKFNTNTPKSYHLHVASDGSTSFVENLTVPARESAGQVIPLAGKYPLQQRTPVYTNLAEDWRSSDTNLVLSGELAIDPEHGRFAFSRQDEATERDNAHRSMPVTADYNYAFSYDVGAGAYDRSGDLKRATMWVSKKGHVPYRDALPSRTFQTIADALAEAKDGDVIQIEDNCMYEENALSNIRLSSRDLTLQAANQMMPTIKLSQWALGLVFDDQLKSPYEKSSSLPYQTGGTTTFSLNGILITGGPITLEGKFNKLALVSCSIDPRYEVKGPAAGVEIKSSSPGAADTCATSSRDEASASKEILLIRSITGGIVVDESVSRLSLKDSIIDNFGGSAIHVRRTNKEEEPNLKLEAERSNILGALTQSWSDFQDPLLELKDICCSDTIFTNGVNIKIRQKDYRTDENNKNGRRGTCGSISHSRIIGKDNDIMNFAFRSTSENPIFISTTFGHPAYMHLDHLTSKSILEGAENTLEMGAFNKNDKPLRMRNLKIRLQEFLPLGIKSGLVYLY